MSKKQNDEKEPKGQNVRAVVLYPDCINVNILVMNCTTVLQDNVTIGGDLV